VNGRDLDLWLVRFDESSDPVPQLLSIPFPVYGCSPETHFQANFAVTDRYALFQCYRGHFISDAGTLADETQGNALLLVDTDSGEVTVIDDNQWLDAELPDITSYSYTQPFVPVIHESETGLHVLYVEKVRMPSGSTPAEKRVLKYWASSTVYELYTIEGVAPDYPERFVETFFMEVDGEVRVHYVVDNTLYRWTQVDGSTEVAVLCDELKPDEEVTAPFQSCHPFYSSAFVAPSLLYAVTGIDGALQKWDLSILPGVQGLAAGEGSPPPIENLSENSDGSSGSSDGSSPGGETNNNEGSLCGSSSDQGILQSIDIFSALGLKQMVGGMQLVPECKPDYIPTCIQNFLTETIGLGANCAGCYVDFSLCIVEYCSNCGLAVSVDNPNCQECMQAAGCTSGLQECAGWDGAYN
jgi:hypothetical protein